MSYKKPVKIQIEKFAKSGNGIGYFERQDKTVWPVEVAFSVPGDEVEASLHGKKSGVYEGHPLELITSSPERIKPRCVHFGVCGGCRWQQISYKKQLQVKEEMLEKCFNQPVGKIIPCEDHWHYRNKMEFTFSSDTKGKDYLGLIMDSSGGKVINLTECHLPNPWFIEVRQAVANWWDQNDVYAYNMHNNTGSLRTLTLREGQRTGDKMVILTVSGHPAYALKRQHLDRFCAFVKNSVKEGNLTIFLRIHQAEPGVPTSFYEMHLFGPEHIREKLYVKTDPGLDPEEMTFLISPAAFFQPNTRQAEKLYSQALKMASYPKNDVVYDLYCGTGTLGICFAKRAKQVVGIEISPDAAYDARANAELNGVNNIEIITGSVPEKLKEIRDEGLLPPPDLVLVDPPRAGLDPQAIEQLIILNAPKILYVSCNPWTQAKNITDLEKAGYRLKALQPVDQFPHTVHVENIALLVKE